MEGLKDRVQATRFGSCLNARGLYLITFIDGMNDKEKFQEMRNGRLIIRWLLTDKLGI